MVIGAHWRLPDAGQSVPLPCIVTGARHLLSSATSIRARTPEPGSILVDQPRRFAPPSGRARNRCILPADLRDGCRRSVVVAVAAPASFARVPESPARHDRTMCQDTEWQDHESNYGRSRRVSQEILRRSRCVGHESQSGNSRVTRQLACRTKSQTATVSADVPVQRSAVRDKVL